MDLKNYIRDIPDFPKPGIVFKDITPLFQSPDALTYALDQIAEYYQNHKISVIAGAEARGFLLGPGLAERLGAGFVPVRKPGKLPAKTISHSYELEYGNDTLEMHHDAMSQEDRVLIVDDLLATGGTVNACIQLIQQLGAEVVGTAFIIELLFLEGRQKFTDVATHSLIQY
jgi:adenine phosphoribosyltransferase